MQGQTKSQGFTLWGMAGEEAQKNIRALNRGEEFALAHGLTKFIKEKIRIPEGYTVASGVRELPNEGHTQKGEALYSAAVIFSAPKEARTVIDQKTMDQAERLAKQFLAQHLYRNGYQKRGVIAGREYEKVIENGYRFTPDAAPGKIREGLDKLFKPELTSGITTLSNSPHTRNINTETFKNKHSTPPSTSKGMKTP